jgi:hypothetical protein
MVIGVLVITIKNSKQHSISFSLKYWLAALALLLKRTAIRIVLVSFTVWLTSLATPKKE